ncbi:hypothetical protein NSA47_10315 [Irregularibacter muris]|uniref:Tetratricopeptide repeat protein n=1 Tax=Irregularibacter muris TaxID=1796619 RepID=A0AAE3HH07_9FIRM|nr:hypothetical protein [Irregularibacter muris]MCR1899377.1 hypothetical protein [Irregularibacter muris]
MRIFDRKFMQYQLAYGIWYNLSSRFLFVGMIFAVISFFSDSILYLLAIPMLYIYGYFRLQYLLNAKDSVYEKRMEKQYKFYERKNLKAQGQVTYQIEKLLFAVELGKIEAKQAIEDVKEILEIRPKLQRIIKGILLSLYLVAKEEDNTEIPQDLIDNLHEVLKEEENPNALVDHVRMALKLEKYDLAIKLIEKAEERKKIYKKQRIPVYRSMYKVLQVSLPYYKTIAYFKSGEKEKALDQLELTLRRAQSQKLRKEIKQEVEGMGII